MLDRLKLVLRAQRLLKSLRWKADMAVVNYFGEHVWLCPCFDSSGKRIGITECCRVSDPCEHHRASDYRTPDGWGIPSSCLRS